MRFDYKLDGAGWATATLSCDEQRVEMTVSYLHDSLKDIASAVLAILRGAVEVKVIFMDEPGEHQLIIRRVDEVNVCLEVNWYDDWDSWGMGAGSHKTLLSCVTRFVHLRGQVLSSLKRILEEHGAAGYLEKWIDEFPLEELRQLQASQHS